MNYTPIMQNVKKYVQLVQIRYTVKIHFQRNIISIFVHVFNRISD